MGLTVTFNQLKAFMAIIEHGSIRAAARELGVVQSGLTQQIKRLEFELGAPLFKRGPGGISLTTEGDVLLSRSRFILSEVGRIEHHFSSLKGVHRGTINIGVLSEAFLRLLPPALHHLQSEYPEIKVHILGGTSTGLLEAINEGKVDFALVQLPGNTRFYADLAVTPLVRSLPVVFCRKGHPLEKATSIRDVADATWIRPRGETGSPSNRLNDWFELHGMPPPRVPLTIESLFDSLHLVCHSDHLFLGPTHALSEGGYNERLSIIPIAEPVPPVDICLVWRASAPLGHAASLFSSMLISYARMLGPARTCGRD